MPLVSQNPNPGELYADVLWNTTRLPATMNNDGSTVKKDGLANSINGAAFVGANPTSQSAMISIINATISITVYNVSSGFDCQNPVNCVGGVRYVAMGGNVNAPLGTQSQVSDILEINSAGVITQYGQVDWRAGPNYNPGPIST